MMIHMYLYILYVLAWVLLHACECVCIFLCVYPQVYCFASVHICVCAYVRDCRCSRACVCVFVLVCACVCVCVMLHSYVWHDIYRGATTLIQACCIRILTYSRVLHTHLHACCIRIDSFTRVAYAFARIQTCKLAHSNVRYEYLHVTFWRIYSIQNPMSNEQVSSREAGGAGEGWGRGLLVESTW